MKLMLAGQVAASPWMNPARWQTAAVTGMTPDDAADHGWHRDAYATLLARGAESAAVATRARAALLAFRVFPPERMIVALPEMTVRPGDTLVQGIRLGPLGLIAAVRVLTVFDRDTPGERRAGFSYVTLDGHPERGAITFAIVEDHQAQETRFEIDAISQPGHWLTRLGAPIARHEQRAATQAALGHMQASANQSSPPIDAP